MLLVEPFRQDKRLWAILSRNELDEARRDHVIAKRIVEIGHHPHDASPLQLQDKTLRIAELTAVSLIQRLHCAILQPSGLSHSRFLFTTSNILSWSDM